MLKFAKIHPNHCKISQKARQRNPPVSPQYCIAYRFFYHCFLALLPITLLFLAFHLFVENCKWNFAGEGGSVPRPWPHTIYLPLIWFFSAAYAVPTVFLSAVRDEPDDIYRNIIARRDTSSAQVCMVCKKTMLAS